MHFIRRFIINADAYDIKMEEVDAWLIVPPCHFPPLLPLSFSRESTREANTPILINSRGISIYSSSRNTRMRGGRGMGPLPLHSRYFSTGQPFLSRPFPTFCKFFSLVPKNNRLSKASRPIARPPSASSHLALQSRRFSSSVLHRLLSSYRRNRFCLDATRARAETKMKLLGREWNFFRRKSMPFSCREIFFNTIDSKRKRGLVGSWTIISFSRISFEEFSEKNWGNFLDSSYRFSNNLTTWIVFGRTPKREYFLERGNSISTRLPNFR